MSEWGVNQIGVMGFSACGYLAVMASVLYDDAATRPDYSINDNPLSAEDFELVDTALRMIRELEMPDKTRELSDILLKVRNKLLVLL